MPQLWGHLEWADPSRTWDWTPALLDRPDPPAIYAVAGGDLEDGDYDYAITFFQDAGGGETEASDVSTISLGGGDNSAEFILPPLPTGADGWKIYRLVPGETDLYLLAIQEEADGR